MGKAKILAITPLLFAMYGCSSDSDSTPKPAGTTSGVFLDAEVEGLSYITDSGVTGTTDENGTYNYTPGDNVSFSVGGVNIGTVEGAPKCTPFDFGAASTNIARFIQSLDADGDPTNGIDIVAANTALAGTIVSSDAFIGDDATFAANTDIQDALTTTGDTLIDPGVALANLNNGTDDTFDATEIDDDVYVVIDPTYGEIGLISFSAPNEVFSLFPEDTTAGGGDGSGFDETYVLEADGTLTFSEVGGTSSTKVVRVGGSSRAISVTYSEAGAAPLPATLLIPYTITDLGGETTGGTTLSKSYDVVDYDGGPAFEVVFSNDNTFVINDGTGDNGFFAVGDLGPNVITTTNVASPTIGDNLTILIIVNGDPTTGTADMLIVDTTIIGGTPSDPELQFDAMGIGSITLTGTNLAP